MAPLNLELSSLSPEYAVFILPQGLLPLLQCLVTENIVPAVNTTSICATTAAQTQDEALKQFQICLHLSSSRLFKLEGTSIGTIQCTSSSGGTSASIPGPSEPSAVVSRRGPAVKVACVNCRNARKQCDLGRPCARCLKRCLGGCEDAPTKRRTPARRSRPVNMGAAPGRQPELIPDNPMSMHQMTSFYSTHLQDADARYGSASLPPEQPTYGASWTEDQSGPSTFDVGTNGQAAYAYSHSAQNVAQLSQPAIPPVAVLPQPAEYLNAAGPTMPAFPFYHPEYTATSQSDSSVAGNPHPQYFGMYPSLQSTSGDPPFNADWQGR